MDKEAANEFKNQLEEIIHACEDVKKTKKIRKEAKEWLLILKRRPVKYMKKYDFKEEVKKLKGLLEEAKKSQRTKKKKI